VRTRALLVLLLIAACRDRPAEPAHEPPQPPYDAAEQGNLLNIALGASVVSRTAEATLDAAATRAIDGDPTSTWQSPPSDPNQTIVFSFAAPTRIEQIGAHTPPTQWVHVKRLRVETSLDGANFTPLAEPEFTMKDEVQLFPVTPTVASYVRVTTVETTGDFAVLYSVHARGSAGKVERIPPIAGCWSINGEEAWFEEKDGAIRGRIGRIALEGDLEGPLYRFIWVDEPYWGYAALTMAPDGKHLSGIKWHEQPVNFGYGTSWFGERRSGCSGAPPLFEGVDKPSPSKRFFVRGKRYPLFSERLAAELAMELLGEGKRIRLVSREYRAGREAAQERVDAFRELLRTRGADLSRVDVTVAGADKPRHPIETEVMRSLYGVVEIEQ
jgi:hypothetical protein